MNITKEQIKRIYALGSAVGILERGNKNDNLHALVFTITGKESISALNGAEFVLVEQNLLRKMQYGAQKDRLRKKTAPPREAAPGMMTEAQKRKAWRMIYQLCELNATGATAGARMRGAVKKILGTDVSLQAPLDWISFSDGGKLIETLKRYVKSAEKKAAREAG